MKTMTYERFVDSRDAILVMNHELRNIISPISFHIQRLSTLEAQKDEDQRSRIVDNAVRVLPERLAAMNKLLRDIQELISPIQMRFFEFKLYDLLESVRSSIMRFPEAANTKLSIQVEPCNITFVADAHWMQRALVNITKNAIEACTGRKEKSVRTHATISEGLLTITVTDNGHGMLPESCARAFKPFYSTKGISGAGLGLSISKRIIEMHDGSIELLSSLEKGTSATITMPHTKNSS
jgi:two-component system, NtrC family, nitrogen regulation sensor histidine kinase NtrY